MKPVCEIHNLSLRLQKNNYLLYNISYEVYQNDFIVILGLNGSGKTSMLKILNGSIKNYSGSIKIAHQEIKKIPYSTYTNYVSTITQNIEDGLFMDFSLMHNFQLYADSFRSQNNYKPFDDFLALLKSINVRLQHLLSAKASTLSGGEKQCFLLALHLFFKRNLLLLDEHTSALDPKTAKNIMCITAEQLLKQNITCIMTTHSLDDALQYGNRLISMKNGQIIRTFNGEAKLKLTKADLLNFCY